MRLRTASAIVGSAITFGQRSKAIWRTQFACDDWKRWALQRDSHELTAAGRRFFAPSRTSWHGMGDDTAAI